MEKRHKIILALVVTTIFTIGYVVITYFGLDRYLMLRLRSKEKYNKLVKEYSSLDPADKCRVVISFTTTPDKIDYMYPTLCSLLDQTVKVDQIALNLPYKCKNKSYNTPEDLEQCANIFKVGKDIGRGTGLIPTLQREGEEDTKIIFVKDSGIYGQGFVEDIVKLSNDNPDEAIMMNDDVLLVKPSFFDLSVVDYEVDNKDMKWILDHLNVPVKKVSYYENFNY